MLMVYDYGRERAGTMGDQQISRDQVILGAGIREPAPAIAGFGFLSIHGKAYRVADGSKP